ncbi:MAG: AAA family ATPase [Lachnospiraceae bacterium]|nr:AAA family ATPase [Lachnospiraceae bacterium]
MKKLLYQHIENVGKIKAQDIYYSYEYNFTYDRKKKILHAEKKEDGDLLSEFYGEHIEGITLLVGENGAGKTTIMELLALPDEKYKKRFASSYFEGMSWFAVYKTDNGHFVIEGEGEFFDGSNKYNARQYRYGLFNNTGNFVACRLTNSRGTATKDLLVYRPVELGIKKTYSDVLFRRGDKRISVDASADVLCRFLLHNYKIYSGHRRPEQHEIIIIQDGPSIDVEIEPRYSRKEIFMLGLLENSIDRIIEYCNKDYKFEKLKKMWNLERKGLEINAYGGMMENDLCSFMNDSLDEFVGRKHIPRKYYVYYMEHIENCNQRKLYEKYAKRYYKLDKKMLFNKEWDLLIKEVIEYYAKRENLYQRVPDKYYIRKNCIRMEISLENEKYFNVLPFAHTYSFNSYLYDEDRLIDPVLRTEFTSLSTGEKVFLGIFASLKENTVDMDNDSMGIICLDEPDNFLHPEWSRLFLDSLVKHLQKCDGKFQIIITSHSPLMTSDLLKRDVWCINGNGIIEQSKSGWMSNIHNVYQDSFYLRSTFGELGQNCFKKKIINELNAAEEQGRGSEKNQEIMELIDEVCDPVLKRVLVMQAEHKKCGE